jgi:peptidoglycan/xylan/chitin deacetylase (PgdA/CDA1 family)
MFHNIIERIKKIRRRKAIILMYHQVCERRCDPWELTVHPKHFCDQLEYLKRHFDVVPISDLAGDIASHKIKKTVAITFDDGFKDNYTNAAPLLDWHELPATFYVATTAMQQEHIYWWDALQDIVFNCDELPERFEMMIDGASVEFTFHSDRTLNSRLMNQMRCWNYNLPIANERIALYMHLWHHIKALSYSTQNEIISQIRDWSGYKCRYIDEAATMSVRDMQTLSGNPLFSIGAHTVHHPMLSQQNAEEQAFEVKESKRQIETWLGKPVDGFAYPYGNFNAVTQVLLKESGFRYAVSTESKPVTAQDDPFALPRVHVKNWCVYEFASKLNEIVNE